MADCAILAVASTTQTALALLQRLVKDVVLDEQTSSLPWTIVNKYYTADVRFLVHSLSSWAVVQHELSVPALLFVWNRGEPYLDQLRNLSQYASRHEVALAIRLSPTGSTFPAEVEDDQDIDVRLSSIGFEFVDVPNIESSVPNCAGIPGIPRIVDALSTIMWPSMVRQGSVGAVQSNPGISSDDYHNLARLVGEKISGKDRDRMRWELEELERWLDRDDADTCSTAGEDEVPWSTVVTPGTLSPSSSGFLENSRPTTPKVGFDDDFTSFVSASSQSSAGVRGVTLESLSLPRFPPLTSTSFSSTFSFDSPLSGHSTPILDDHANFDTARLVHRGPYKSLGSMSDLGDQDKESMHFEPSSNSSDGEGEDMPPRFEIAETSQRIFGTMSFSPSPTQEQGDRNFQSPTALGGAPFQSHPSGELDVEMADASLERFDLQGVLGALQGLKEEISGMPDEERRKAAARVALGLVYGLNPHPEASKELV